MARIKGSKKTGGRAKGTPNKVTTNARESIALFVDGNVDRLITWLDEIALSDPKKAFDAFMSVVEYHVPKLQRTELTGKDGKEFNLANLIAEARKRVAE